MPSRREMPPAAAACYSASLLPLPNQNDSFPAVAAAAAAAAAAADRFSSLSTAFQAEQSSLDLYDPQCEDEAELEWFSQFMEESSVCDVPDPPPGPPPWSKRPRSAASVALSSPSSPSPSSSSSSNEFSSDGSGRRRKKGAAPRRCTHCESEKTPQWRTGPLGPKTLCNACGVRYKSGRLVPEYRPAASPTIVLTQHSNSHRKVMELRRQKELFLLLPRPQHSNADASSAARPEIC